MPDLAMWDLDLASFVDRTASTNPTPGGGSAAMVSAAIGMALVLMALRVTAEKTDDTDAIDPLIRSGEKVREDLAAHADADVGVFEAYMVALRLPRENDEEKAIRREKLAEARRAATEVPLNAAHTALDGLEIALQAAHVADVAIVSDVGAGAALLNGALTATLYNVDINLRGMKDAERQADYQASRAELQQAGTDRHETVRRVLSSRLSD
ncbi:MAG: cyclodeaminase/cyclohydrolase family protein [Pseudomonadota bacterium]